MKLDTQFSKVELMVEGQTLTLSEDELYQATEKCVEIAEKFAIEFGRWLENLSYEFYETTIAETYEELLEIYKKTL